jgi:transposase-like protein
MTMSMGKPRDLQKEQEWRRRLREWQRSGLGVSTFCRRYGLVEKHLYRWRRILAERDAEQAAFVPVHLLTENASPNGVLEVVLTGGRRLRVPKGFDAATLRQLLAVLEEQTSC